MAKLQSYALSVALTKMKHSVITAKSGQKCLVLPIEDNYLTLIEKDGQTAVYMQTDVVTMDSEDTNGNWGFQVQKLPSEIWKSLGADKAKEIKDLPYLGNLKIFAKKTNDVSEPVNIDLDEEHDDLPF
jgi:hypothetical protein